MTRLESLSPEIAGLLSQANSRVRRHAALTACEAGVRTLRLNDPTILDALAQLQQGRLSVEVKVAIDALCNSADDEYFSLQDQSDQRPELKRRALELFSKARVCAAVSFAGNDSPGGASESIYEAAASLDDNRPVLDAVYAVLTA